MHAALINKSFDRSPFDAVGRGFPTADDPMNYPAASCGVSKDIDKNFPKGVTPECFYRGSSPKFRLDSCLPDRRTSVMK
jgi:hypothetical protein